MKKGLIKILSILLTMAIISNYIPIIKFKKASAATLGKSKNVAFVEDYNTWQVAYFDPSDYSDQNFTILNHTNISSESLAGYDTMIFFMFNPSLLTVSQKNDVINWVSNGGKLIIWDSDAIPSGQTWDYTWLPFPFTSSVPGAQGASGKGLEVVKESQFASSDPTSPFYIDTNKINNETDAVGDANVMETYTSGWNIDMIATNTLGKRGPAHAHAPFGQGMFIYSALETAISPVKSM